jgi:hypothetical protein
MSEITPKPMDPVHTSTLLMCRLTQEEAADRGEQIAQALNDLKEAEERKRNENEIIKARKKTVDELRAILLNGQELRDVPITITFDMEKLEADITRDDTEENVGHRPMTLDEKQPPLFLEEEGAETDTPFDQDGDEPITIEKLPDALEPGEAEPHTDAELKLVSPETPGWCIAGNSEDEDAHYYNGGELDSVCGNGSRNGESDFLLTREFFPNPSDICQECWEHASGDTDE